MSNTVTGKNTSSASQTSTIDSTSLRRQFSAPSAGGDDDSSGVLLPETTRPPPAAMSRVPWSNQNSMSARDNAVSSTPHRSLRDIMDEQARESERARVDLQEKFQDAQQIAVLEQEEELVRLALERSLTDFQSSSRSLQSSSSLDHSQRSQERFSLKVQQEAETTEGFVESPHRLRRSFLIRPESTNNGHGDEDLVPKRDERGIDDSAHRQHLVLAEQMSAETRTTKETSFSPQLLAELGLEEAATHLSRTELEEIVHALRESTGGSDTTEKADNSEAIGKAIKEADDKEASTAEQESIQLALQLLKDDQELLASQVTSNGSQGNVRVLTNAQLAAETSGRHLRAHRSDKHSNHEIPVEFSVAAGFRMNAAGQQEWVRRDQHSIIGPNNEIRTKHDAELESRANSHRLGLDAEDEDGPLIGNRAYNSFLQSFRRSRVKGVAAHGTGRAGQDVNSTKGGAMDPSVRVEISRAINNGLIVKCNGVVKEGKEAIIYHADRGSESSGYDVAVKVFKRISEFRGRGNYVEGDPRYARKNFRQVGQREQLALWTEKEYRNLVRAHRAGIPTPTPLLFKENVLFMQFLGTDHWPAPQLREVQLRTGSKRWSVLYHQILDAVKKLYCEARLVHGDLSEYNVLVAPASLIGPHKTSSELQAFLIDFGQAVDVRHPEALSLLDRDIEHINFFFQHMQTPEMMSLEDARKHILNVTEDNGECARDDEGHSHIGATRNTYFS